MNMIAMNGELVDSNSVRRKRGRPLNSLIRQNIVDLLFVLGNATGYEIAKLYPKYFSRCTQRVIYYHLRKGTGLGIFSVDKIAVTSGSYSWGPTSEKIYYSVGPNAVAVSRNELGDLVSNSAKKN